MITHYSSKSDLQAYAPSGKYNLWLSPVYRRPSPQNAVSEGLYTLAEDMRPEANPAHWFELVCIAMPYMCLNQH